MKEAIVLRSTDNKLVYLPECPEEPNIIDHAPEDQFLVRFNYQSALSEAIKNGIEFADQDAAASMLCRKHTDGNLLWQPRKDHPYPLPKGVDVKVREEKRCQYMQINGNCDDCFRGNLCATIKLAYITEPSEDCPFSSMSKNNPDVMSTESSKTVEKEEPKPEKGIESNWVIQGQDIPAFLKWFDEVLHKAAYSHQLAHEVSEETKEILKNMSEPKAFKTLQETIDWQIKAMEEYSSSLKSEKDKWFNEAYNTAKEMKTLGDNHLLLIQEKESLKEQVEELKKEVEYWAGIAHKNTKVVRETQSELSPLKQDNDRLREVLDKISRLNPPIYTLGTSGKNYLVDFEKGKEIFKEIESILKK